MERPREKSKCCYLTFRVVITHVFKVKLTVGTGAGRTYTNMKQKQIKSQRQTCSHRPSPGPLKLKPSCPSRNMQSVGGPDESLTFSSSSSSAKRRSNTLRS